MWCEVEEMPQLSCELEFYEVRIAMDVWKRPVEYGSSRVAGRV